MQAQEDLRTVAALHEAGQRVSWRLEAGRDYVYTGMDIDPRGTPERHPFADPDEPSFKHAPYGLQ
jgi:hypothetical protein